MFDVIIPAAGKSLRVGFDKLNEKIGRLTVLQRTVNAFYGLKNVNNIIVAGENDIENVISVAGGNTRTESVLNALEKVTSEYVLIHDAARPFLSRDLIERVMTATLNYGAAVPVLPFTDTVAETDGENVVRGADRTKFATVQTPQGFSVEILKKCFALYNPEKESFTDESSLVERYHGPCKAVLGEPSNKKLTYASDFYGINARVGTGFDLHLFTENKPLRLCGVTIPYRYGLLAHSDGDVAIHALMDALLTGAGERDIGVLFPDNDPKYENADSTKLLLQVAEILKNKNLSISSVNIVIIAQNPKLSPHIDEMRKSLSSLLEISLDRVGISATTTEGVGDVGESKAIASVATVILN